MARNLFRKTDFEPVTCGWEEVAANVLGLQALTEEAVCQVGELAQQSLNGQGNLGEQGFLIQAFLHHGKEGELKSPQER